MRMKIVIIAIVLITAISQSQAQHVKVRLNFPVVSNLGAPGHRYAAGTVWIGPEWQWRGGRYVSVPGYWARPKHHRAVWIPGHWQYSRRGYKWVPGHWR